MLHETHTTILGPAFFVVVSHNVLVVRVRVFGQVALDQVFRFFLVEPEDHEYLVDIAAEETNGMAGLYSFILVAHEVIRLLRGSSQIRGTTKS